MERCGPDDPKPLLDCFLENEADPVPTCAAVRKLYRYGHDSCGKILDCLQKFERHPSEYRAKDDWKAPAKAPQMPQEAGKADDPPPATRIESARLRNGETFSWEQPPLLREETGMGGNRSETVGCDVCARCGAVIAAVPTADGERRCAGCGGSDFFASTVDVDAPLFERDCYQLARCAERVDMWSAVRQYGRAPSALVLCPFLRGRAGIRLAPLVVAGAMADEERPFRRPASCVGDAEPSELAMMGDSAAADELRLRGLPARRPLCGSAPTVERSTTGLAVGGRLALLSVRCGCGFEACERMPFELFEAGEGVARAHMLDRALAKWNARAVAVPSLARIVRMLKEHTVE